MHWSMRGYLNIRRQAQTENHKLVKDISQEKIECGLVFLSEKSVTVLQICRLVVTLTRGDAIRLKQYFTVPPHSIWTPHGMGFIPHGTRFIPHGTDSFHMGWDLFHMEWDSFLVLGSLVWFGFLSIFDKTKTETGPPFLKFLKTKTRTVIDRSTAVLHGFLRLQDQFVTGFRPVL